MAENDLLALAQKAVGHAMTIDPDNLEEDMFVLQAMLNIQTKIFGGEIPEAVATYQNKHFGVRIVSWDTIAQSLAMAVLKAAAYAGTLKP